MSPTKQVVALPTLLSWALVAYTIELDNLAELGFAHHITDAKGSTTAGDDTSKAVTTSAPWLVSWVCWATMLQYVGRDGITVAQLRQRARTDRLLLDGLRRWRYVRLTPPRGKSDDTLLQMTRHGRAAAAVWSALPRKMDQRWRARFGAVAVERLHSATAAVFTQLPLDPPDYLPVVYPAMSGRTSAPVDGPPSHTLSEGTDDLLILVAGVLYAFTVNFEAENRLALAMSANTLRVLDANRLVHVRDLPALTGCSKEGNAMALTFLERRQCATVEADPEGGRAKVVRLSARGVRAQANAERNIAATETQWRRTYGAKQIDALRAALEPLVGDGTPAGSPLTPGLAPAPANWRARVKAPATLPYSPMVLHRGGYPDGS